jgi:hypothetical protein
MVAPDSPHVPEVTALIAELDKLIADLDRKPPETAPPAEPAPPPEPAPAVAAPAPVPAAPPPAASAPAALIGAPAHAPAEPPPSSGHRWWLWGLAGAVVVGAGVAGVLVLSSPQTSTVHDGSLGTLRR